MGKNKQMVSKLNKEILLKIKNKENVTELEFFLVKMLNTEFTKEIVRKLFTGIYRDIKRKFGVASYKDIKVVEYEKALSFIENWIEDKEVI